MSDQNTLATRALRKLKVIGATEYPSAEDQELALQSITDAHNLWAGAGLLRWTLDTIPQEVDLAYVLMAAYLAADDFVQPKDEAWSRQAWSTVQTFVNFPTDGPIYSLEL